MSEWTNEDDLRFKKKVDILRQVCKRGTPAMYKEYLDKLTGGDWVEQMWLLEKVPIGEKIRMMLHPDRHDSILDTNEAARAPIDSGGEMLARMGWRPQAGA